MVLWFVRVTAVPHNGNVTLDQIITIARTMRARSMAKTLAGTVKEILGTAYRCVCVSC
jgi:large subunit ribosomal protein L12e